MLHVRHPWLYTLMALGAAGTLSLGAYLSMPGGSPSRRPADPTATIGLSAPDGPVPPAIHTTVRRGALVLSLTIGPVDVGPARFVVAARAGGRPVAYGQVRLRLSMPSQPMFGVSTFVAAPCGEGYCGRGQLSALGRWHVEVLGCRGGGRSGCVRIPLDFMNGANARFLFAQRPDTRFGPATVLLARTPPGTSALRVHLRAGLVVRAVVEMPNMLSMGTAGYAAQPEALGWYRVPLAFPMAGVMQIVLQVQTRSGWWSVRTLLFDVDSAGNAALLTGT